MRFWTTSELRILKERYPEEGSAIASDLGRSRESVRTQAMKQGIKYVGPERPSDPVIKVLIREREKRGLIMDDIAKCFPCHRRSVWRWEIGERSPTLETLREWLEIFDFDLKVVKKRNKWH